MVLTVGERSCARCWRLGDLIGYKKESLKAEIHVTYLVMNSLYQGVCSYLSLLVLPKGKAHSSD